MATDESLQDLVLRGVNTLKRKELGRGAYGRVYAVEYCEMICAAKEIHSILVENGNKDRRHIVQSFLKECHQCSKLRHPNIIQFLGVYYPEPTGNPAHEPAQLPVMVMEMMADSLTSFVDKRKEIPDHIKFSIVHDVALGLCYLHNHDPPIVHRDLSPNNILLTAYHVAKISDLGVAKVIKADSKMMTKLTQVPGTIDFMPPEANTQTPIYGTAMDVFSFAGIILHMFNQCWPTPKEERQYDSATRKMVALSEIERRQQHLDKMTGAGKVLRPLVEECLDCDPKMRPEINNVYGRIKAGKDDLLKEPLQDSITLYQQLEKLKDEIAQERVNTEKEIALLKSNNECLKRTVEIQAKNLTREVPVVGKGSKFDIVSYIS